jgi:hypothetical protein
MSQLALPLPSRRTPSFRPIGPEHDASIVEDLRSFARDVGVVGWSAMTKEELVESLRQSYLLAQIRNGAGERG